MKNVTERIARELSRAILGIAVVPLAACGVPPSQDKSDSQEVRAPSADPRARATAPSLVGSRMKRFTVPPKVASVVWFDAPAGTKCALPNGGNAVYYANEQDRVEVELTPRGASPPTELAFSCDDSAHLVEVTVREGVAALAAPPRVKHSGTTLPALSPEVAASFTNKQLRDRGYPIRPDPDRYPDLYAKWLDNVSRSFEYVGGSGPDIATRATTAGNTWCGQGICPSGSTTTAKSGFAIDYVMGWWTVPSIVATDPGAAMSEWVGLDGGGLSDLMQAGVNAQVDSICIFTCFDIVAYNFFWQALPAIQNESLFSGNPAVSAGDRVWAEVEVWPPKSGTTEIDFYIENFTNNTFAMKVYDYASCPYVGASAEWIVENPELGSSGTDLAEWSGAAEMLGYAGTAQGVFFPGGSCVESTGCASPTVPSCSWGPGMNGHDVLDEESLVNDGESVSVSWEHFK